VSRPRVAMAGNPNTGKTSVFNRLTGAQGRVGNYPGVTVELMAGELDLGPAGRVEVLDVPGTYSLVARSKEEEVAIGCLLGLRGLPPPQLVVCCVDATNLSRNLYFVLQAQELGLNLVVALTMTDEAAPGTPGAPELAKLLGCPVVSVVGRTGHGIDALRTAIAGALGHKAEELRRWQPSALLQERIGRVHAALPAGWPASEALSLWALMSVSADDELDVPSELRQAVQRELPDEQAGNELDAEVIRARYDWIDQQLPHEAPRPPARGLTERADAVLIHPLFGFAIFLLVNLVMFQSLFSWSEPAIGAIESLFTWTGEWVGGAMAPGILRDLLVEGVIGGVGSVVVFLPQIMLLFVFIGIMEDSGYMARVAYLMDRIMKSMGLHGRAFVPMMSGFACAIPAILATRTMDRQRDRLLTMMVVPLMTCSARLPVYTLVIAALFPTGASWLGIPVQGGLMVAMYLFSVVIALLAAWVLSKTVLPTTSSVLILELPPYRLPRLVDVLRMTWQRSGEFLRGAGTVILACSIVLWFLLNFPRHEPDPALDPVAQHSAALADSYGGKLGHAIEPAIAPLGFDWKIGVGIVGAFAAREVFVATMGVVYSAGEDLDETDETLRDKLRNEKKADGTPAYTPLMGLSLLVFFALACQCMSTLAVVKRETHGYKWPAFLFVYMTALAWVCSFIIYQGGRALGLG
jgi:ferrous iron transport protein B